MERRFTSFSITVICQSYITSCRLKKKRIVDDIPSPSVFNVTVFSRVAGTSCVSTVNPSKAKQLKGKGNWKSTEHKLLIEKKIIAWIFVGCVECVLSNTCFSFYYVQSVNLNRVWVRGVSSVTGSADARCQSREIVR